MTDTPPLQSLEVDHQQFVETMKADLTKKAEQMLPNLKRDLPSPV